MRVGIDGGCWGNRRGYGRFFREVLAEMPALDPSVQYTIFLDVPAGADNPLPDGVRAVHGPTSAGVNETAHAGGRRPVSDLLRMSWAVAREKMDVFYFPSVYSYFPLLRPAPMLLGICDTIPDRHPEFAFATRREQRFWDWKMRLALAQAQRVLTISQYSQRCIHDQFGWPMDKIDVVHLAASRGFHPGESAARDPYVLYVGGISPNKNLAVLIRAFARLHQRAPGVKLVLGGDHQTDGFKSSHAELAALIQAESLAGLVEFTGYVPESELRGLYCGARLLAFPSLDEGFGLPAVEAMACGLPVVASRGHALEEVVGEAGLLVDARNEGELAEAMERILTDPALAAALRAKSLRRAADFSWKKTAEGLLNVLRAMAGAEQVRR
ncbi:MAG TPA: glycosyltransferase family 1 protein [Paludibaculum sp.]